MADVTLKSNGRIRLSHKFKQKLDYRFKKIMAKHGIPQSKETSIEAKALICLLDELVENAPRHYRNRKRFKKRR